MAIPRSGSKRRSRAGKVKYRRHARALKYAGRGSAMSEKRWPKIDSRGSSGGTYSGRTDMGRLCFSPNGKVQIDDTKKRRNWSHTTN